MALLDELRKLTQPYDEEDDFFDGSEESFQTAAQSASAAQTDFENAFSNSAGNRNPELEERAYAEQEAYDQRVAGRRRPFQGLQQNAQSANQGKKTGRKNVNVPGSDINVILFNPKSFDEAGELADHLRESRSVLMSLDALPVETARRLLDCISGITFALNGKITPVAAKAYFITPENVNLIDG